jgi:hypothetical protein
MLKDKEPVLETGETSVISWATEGPFLRPRCGNSRAWTQILICLNLGYLRRITLLQAISLVVHLWWYISFRMSTLLKGYLLPDARACITEFESCASSGLAAGRAAYASHVLSKLLDWQIPCLFVLVVGAWGWRPHLSKEKFHCSSSNCVVSWVKIKFRWNQWKAVRAWTRL